MITSTRLFKQAVTFAVAACFFLTPKASSADPRLEWGVYQIYWSRRDYPTILKKELSRFASKPDYVMFYRDLHRRFPLGGITTISEIGAMPIISLELGSWHDGKTRFLPKIIAGEFDDHFRKWAHDAKRYGGRVLLRFGFEFNGDWFSWCGNPKNYVAAWRRAHGIFKEVGASNVVWVWAANITSHPEGPQNDMHLYYPGDAYVDWVGVDGYNWGDDYEPWHKWKSFDELFRDVLKDFARRYPTKPIMIAEFGCPEGAASRKAQWIRESFASAKRYANLRALVWFNFDKRREGELNFRVDSSAEALRAFNETFAAPAKALTK